MADQMLDDWKWANEQAKAVLAEAREQAASVSECGACGASSPEFIYGWMCKALSDAYWRLSIVDKDLEREKSKHWDRFMRQVQEPKAEVEVEDPHPASL